MKGRWTQLSCSVCVCAYVCLCGVLSVLSLYLLTLVWLKEGETYTHRPLCFSVYLWPMDLTIVSPKESGRGGSEFESTVDNRGLVSDWYSCLWLFSLQPLHIFVQFIQFLYISCLNTPECHQCAYMWVPHDQFLLPWWCGGHGRLGSSTAGHRAEINCDCDSGERRIKQQAIKDWHDLGLSTPPATGNISKGNFSLSNILAATFKISLSLISVSPCSALWEMCVLVCLY